MKDGIELLHALAAGLCQDAGVSLVVDEGGWAWSPRQRTLIVPPHAVDTLGLDACAGVVAHEIGHAYLSRYGLFAEVDRSPAFVRFLLNALEDPRVEGFMVARYPGARPWLEATESGMGGALVRLPSLQLILRIVREGRVAAGVVPGRELEAPDTLHADVQRALAATREARRQYVRGFWPTVDFSAIPADALARHEAEVVPALADGVSHWPPSQTEAWVRLNALAAWQLARDRIVPAALEVLEADIERIARLAQQSREFSQGAQAAIANADVDIARLVAFGAVDTESSLSDTGEPMSETCLALGRGVMEVIFGGSPRSSTSTGASASHGDVGDTEGDGTGVDGPRSAYGKVLAPVATQVAELTRVLDAALRPRRRLRLSSGHASGRRVDLRRAMAFESDPRRGGELWLRPKTPDRRSAAFVLLVDLSGSMRGEKIARTLSATVLFAETLSRLQIPFAIAGFQDQVIPVHDFGAPFDPAAEARLAELQREVSGDRPNGHNQPAWNDDGPCLREAAAELCARGEDDRIVVVLSDGAPEGRRSSEEDLPAAIADLGRHGLSLIGIGVGDGTEHVRDYYPRALASVPLDELPRRVGAVLREVLERAA